MPSIESLIENSPVLQAVVDESQSCIAVSGAWARRLDLGGGAISLPVIELFAHESGALLAMRLADVLAEGRTVARLPVALKSPAGPAHGLLSAWPVVADDGRSCAMIVVLEADELNEAYEGLTRQGPGRQLALDAQRRREAEQGERRNDRLARERAYLREQDSLCAGSGTSIGASVALERLISQIAAIAASNANMLLHGERGAGKETVARAVHARSARAEGPFIKVNCAATDPDALASLLLGPVGSASALASTGRSGRLGLAMGGTLFLEEVGAMPLDVQQRLANALRGREPAPAGQGADIDADLLVAASSTRDLAAEVEAGRFRADLHYLLSVLSIEVPPLRQRRDDIVPMAEHFAAVACRAHGYAPLEFSPAQAARLLSYDWPGNIRELRYVVERAVLLSRGERLRLGIAVEGRTDDRPAAAGGTASDGGFMTHAEFREAEKRNITAALRQAEGKVWGPGGAAELLGMKPSTLTYRMKILAIEKAQ